VETEFVEQGVQIREENWQLFLQAVAVKEDQGFGQRVLLKV